MISSLYLLLTSKIQADVQLAFGAIAVEDTEGHTGYGGESALAKRACVFVLSGEKGTLAQLAIQVAQKKWLQRSSLPLMVIR